MLHIGAFGVQRSPDGTLIASLDGLFNGRLLARSKLIDIAMFQATEEAGETKDKQDREKERLIPARDLPLSLLEKADMDITLAVDELKLKKDSLTDLSIDTQVNAGAMQLRELSFNAPKGRFTPSLSIQPTSDKNAEVSWTSVHQNSFSTCPDYPAINLPMRRSLILSYICREAAVTFRK